MTFEELDRTVFELIRLQVVAAGYLVDMTAYGTEAAYVAANDVLKDSLPDKQLIHVFGVGKPSGREEIVESRIVIDRVNSELGTIGAFPEQYFEDNGDDTFDKVDMASNTEDVMYDIRIITNKIKFERVCRQIVRDALGIKKYITSITTSENMFIQMIDDVPLTATENIEISLRFVISDLFLEQEIVVNQSIPKLETVHGKFAIRGSNDDLDNEEVDSDDTEITYTDT